MDEESAYIKISRNLYFKSQEFEYRCHDLCYDDRKIYHMHDAIYNQNCEIIRLLKVISENIGEF